MYVYLCVCVAIEQHSRKFDGLIVWSLVTFLTFPECWTIWLFDEVSVHFFFRLGVYLLSERKVFAVRLNLHFTNFDFVEWKYLLLLLVALSLCVCVFVWSVTWVTFVSTQYVRDWIDCFCLCWFGFASSILILVKSSSLFGKSWN